MQAVRLALLGLAILTLVAACWLTGCGGAKADAPATGAPTVPALAATTSTSTPIAAAAAKPRPAPPKPVDPIVVLHTTDGDIQVQLFLERAPQTVDNFLRNYVQRQYYDGTIFHHVEAGSLVIAGGYTADLQAKPTRAAIFNEAQNGLKNTRGMVAMIRDPANTHSATSQFFINVGDNPALDYQVTDSTLPEQSDAAWGYCVFGQVTAGMEVVDHIAQARVAPQGDFEKVPIQTVSISSIQQLR